MIIWYSVLALLCLCLLILCLVLFVPFRYTSDGYKNAESYLVRAKLTYIWPLFVLKAIISPKQNGTSVKIFGFPWRKRPDKTESNNEVQSPHPQEKKPAKAKKKKRFKGFVKDIEYYVNLWKTDKELLLDVLRTICNALAKILPKDVEANVVFGTGMADVTGFIYAVYCVLESHLPKGISVTPLWIEKHLEGEYKLRGKIRLFPLLVAFIKIISNKNVRILYNKVRRV